MRGWSLTVALAPSPDQPIFLQLARAISDDVRRGRLRPGDVLPGSRTLARTLGVHRNTVLAAYQELAAEGWITTAQAAGTFVSPSLPEVARRRGGAARAERLGFDLGPSPDAEQPDPPPPGALAMLGGVPDVRLLPTAALARNYRRALHRFGSSLLGYGDARGHARLRTALAEMLAARRGLSASADTVLVTRGSQQALDLCARALLDRGDAVAVEAFGYRPAWTALRAAGAELHPVPVDEQGLRIDALEQLAARRRLRAVYVTPHHQYPTTAVLDAGRRLELLALARRHRLAVLEDDYDNEFHYEGRPLLPLAAADRAGVVVYIGTLSKILAPGLRLGFVVAPPPLSARLAQLRAAVDRQGDQTVECAVAELIEDGELQRHARRMRRIYEVRRDALVAALRARLGERLRFSVPKGGMALWAEAPGVDVDAWSARALRRGVAFYSGRRFAFDGQPHAALRLGFAALDESELTEGVRRMSAALATNK